MLLVRYSTNVKVQRKLCMEDGYERSTSANMVVEMQLATSRVWRKTNGMPRRTFNSYRGSLEDSFQGIPLGMPQAHIIDRRLPALICSEICPAAPNSPAPPASSPATE